MDPDSDLAGASGNKINSRATLLLGLHTHTTYRKDRKIERTEKIERQKGQKRQE